MEITASVEPMELLEKHKQILLGINFLDQVAPYNIDNKYLGITIGDYIRKEFPRVKLHIEDITRNIHKGFLLNSTETQRKISNGEDYPATNDE